LVLLEQKGKYIMRQEDKVHMRIKNIFFFITVISSLWISCAKTSPEDNIKWITHEDIAKSLKNQPPINVGFDIDDTVLFSTPAYHYGKQKYSPYSNEYLNMEEFWNELNNGLDNFSLPKKCARRLINLHKKRGDSIYFITARKPTKTETVTELLSQTFGLENINRVIFTGWRKGANLKLKPLKEYNIQIYYGDSDSDIQAAQSAGIRAIRIMRARNSTKKPLPKNGSLGEEVLVNSDY
jgi:acid phosphatase (class B)